MHTRSRTRSIAVPRPPQSVAALLPPEIVDCIFSHFDFDYSVDAADTDETERTSNLSGMSVVTEGWKGPARRRLCRTVRFVRWDQLAEGVPGWARGRLQNAWIQYRSWQGAQSHNAASALLKFFQHAPNLRLLHLDCPPFHLFDAGDSTLMRTTLLLPLLRDLNVFSRGLFPHSVISDILATSNRQISRLQLLGLANTTPPIAGERVDFGGNLRYLRLDGIRLLDHLQPFSDNLVGLKEIHVGPLFGMSGYRSMELWSTVAPTLEKLTIGYDDFVGIAESIPLLTRLTRLSLHIIPASPRSLLLPPSLVSFHFVKDDNLLPLLNRWNTEPSLLPTTLQQINAGFVYRHQTLERLPPLSTFGASYYTGFEDLLNLLAPRTLPFKTLEVDFHPGHSDRIAAVEAECKRLEVKFCRRFKYWN